MYEIIVTIFFDVHIDEYLLKAKLASKNLRLLLWFWRKCKTCKTILLQGTWLLVQAFLNLKLYYHYFLFLQLSDPLATDESLEDLIGPELAGMVANPSVAQRVKHVPTSATSTSNSASDLPPDISDLRSQDLLSTLSGVGVDIDRMFEEVSD